MAWSNRLKSPYEAPSRIQASVNRGPQADRLGVLNLGFGKVLPQRVKVTKLEMGVSVIGA